MIVHEIGTHLVRAYNGSQLPYKIFQTGTPGYILTEEGLAMYNERTIIDKHDEKFYWPARNLLGVSYALEHNFYDTFQYILALGYTKHQAFKLATRFKRGIGDTSVPGAYTKDIVYFLGERLIRNFIEKQNGDIQDLYLGKIGIDDIENIKYVIRKTNKN